MQKMKIGVFKCADCGCNATLSQCDHEYGEYYCPECGGDGMKFNRENPATWYSVGVYSTSREYGGPEEGGWYYDTGRLLPETLRSYSDDEFEEAKAYYERLKAEIAQDSAGPLFLVQYYAEEHVMAYPKKRPYYC